MRPGPTRSTVDLDGALDCAEWTATTGASRAPLVFLHEGLGSVDLWRGFPARIARVSGRRTLVFSRHGYGRSAVVGDPRPPTYMHHEAQVVLPRLLDRLGYADPVLVGHSDGASIALIHAASGAGTPTALALLAPHVVVEELTLTAIAAAREAWASTDLPQRMAPHHDDAEATFRGWNDVWLSPAFRGFDLTPLLPGVTCPVLLVQGEQDQYGTMHQLDLVEGGVDGPVTRVALPHCRHAPHLDQPDATARALLALLDQVG